MSNSKLVTYTRISPNKNSPRNQNIYIISPHCVVGQVTVERLGEIFANPNRDASSNYGIGLDGRVGMYVEEKDRSWCTSSAWNDNRAVTIEVASDTFHPYAITDAAYDRLIDLMTDICQRNGKNKILWFGDKDKTLNYSPKPNEMIITVHRWFDTKSCPGEYIYSRLGKIAQSVNTRLGALSPEPVIPFERIAGKNRYETSKQIAGKSARYTLVSGESYADALSAAWFARREKAPLLLVNPKDPEDTLEFVKDAAKIYVIGGEGAVPKAITDKLRYAERIEGRTRYDTNLELLKRSEGNSQLLICSGKNFPDGLCAGMINSEVMLVSDIMSYDQLKVAERFFNYVIIGGTGAVSNIVERQLKELGPVERLSGATRYATSRMVAEKFYPAADTLVMASGASFPDGLCASNLGTIPLLLVNDNNYMEAQKYISKLKPKKAYVVGGKGAVSDNAANWALTKLTQSAR